MRDLEKMVIDELTKGVNDGKGFVIFRHKNQSVLAEIRQIAERFGAKFVLISSEVENYVLTMTIKEVRKMEQSTNKKTAFVVAQRDGKRLAIAKHKIISVKELTEQNSIGVTVHKTELLLENADEHNNFTEITVDDSFDNIMLQLEG